MIVEMIGEVIGRRVTPLLIALSLCARGVGAQEGARLASQIDGVQSGTVRIAFAARAGVCGNGMSWFRARGGLISGNVINGSWSGGRDVDATCDGGPVRLVIVRVAGETTDMRMYVGGTWRADTGVTDLGRVSAPDAGAYLLRIAQMGTAKAARTAITAATVADSLDPSATLLRIAKDDSRPSDVRSSALNWLGEIVGDKVAMSLDSLAYEPGDREVRKQAIFAMSRRPADEAVPALLKMVETLPDRELRKTAVFWLAQSKDPRAVRWIESRLNR